MPHRAVARERGALHFDPWVAGLGLGLLVFSGSLLVATLVVLRSIDARAHRALPTLPLPLSSNDDAAGQPAVSLTPETLEPAPVVAPAWAGEIESPKVAAVAVRGLEEDPRLTAAIAEALGAESEHFGVVVKRLGDGRGAAVNPDKEFYAASLFKLAVLEEVEQQLSSGTIRREDRLALTEDDVNEDLGTLGSVPLDESGSLSITSALQVMIDISDNSTAVALMHLVGSATIDERLKQLGLQHTSVNTRDLPTTAADMALLMEAIVTGRDMTEDARLEMRELLLAQETRDGIPVGLPRSVPVGNKTGTWENATHDVAFVDSPAGTYVLAVLSESGGDWAPIQKVGAAVYRVMTGGE